MDKTDKTSETHEDQPTSEEEPQELSGEVPIFTDPLWAKRTHLLCSILDER